MIRSLALAALALACLSCVAEARPGNGLFAAILLAMGVGGWLARRRRNDC